MTTVLELQQAFTPGKIIELFEIDLSPLGDPTVDRYVNDVDESGQPVSYGSNFYLPLPIKADGFAWDKGKQPRPKLRMANLDNAITPILLAYDDLSGALVTRIKTFEAFLDTGSNPDGEAFLSREIYTVDRKSLDDGREVEIELASLLDQQGVTLPRRRMTKGYCGRIYRKFDSESDAELAAGLRFDYTLADCPYSGDAMFTRDNESTLDHSLDVCDKSPTGCQLRFPQPSIMPGHFFPSLGLTRAR